MGREPSAKVTTKTETKTKTRTTGREQLRRIQSFANPEAAKEAICESDSDEFMPLASYTRATNRCSTPRLSRHGLQTPDYTPFGDMAYKETA
jgi:hypothetical protein